MAGRQFVRSVLVGVVVVVVVVVVVFWLVGLRLFSSFHFERHMFCCLERERTKKRGRERDCSLCGERETETDADRQALRQTAMQTNRTDSQCAFFNKPGPALIPIHGVGDRALAVNHFKFDLIK